MSKYTSTAAVTRDEDIGDTLYDYLGEVRSNTSNTVPQNKVSTTKPQGPAQNIELKGSPADMVLQLNEYKQKGLISEKDFENMKKQILGI